MPGYTLRIPSAWISELRWQGQDKGIQYYIMAGLIMQESSWDPNARGDYREGVNLSWGLGQLQAGAAKDAGWRGTNIYELLEPLRNIALTARYLQLCRGWAEHYGNVEVNRYGINACMLSVYNQGPGGFASRGIIANKASYVDPVLLWATQIQMGGIVPDDGSLPLPPELPPDPKTPPPVPPGTPPDLSALLSKYAQAVEKQLATDRMFRPWPTIDEFKTLPGQLLYYVATALYDLRRSAVEWLGLLNLDTEIGD